MNTILVSYPESAIAELSFNRPNNMNTLNDVMAEELLNALNEIENNPNIRVLILKGSGSQFMAGGDIEFFYKHMNQIGAQSEEIIKKVHQASKRLIEMPKVVIASVQGAVAGIGVSFMLACDLIIAAENTVFTMAYSGIGASPDGGATYHLPRIVGYHKALELLLFSERFNARQAHEWGLVNKVVSENDREHEVLKLAKQIVMGPKISYQHIKTLLRHTYHHTIQQQLDLEAKYFVEAACSEDFAKRVTAFISKKKTS